MNSIKHLAKRPYMTEMKNTLEEMNSRLGDTEDLISNLVDGIMEITKSEWKKINE